MSLKSAVAYCRIDDSFAAGEAAMKVVMKQLEGQIPNFLFLFATVGHDLTQLIQGIHSVAGGDIPICGCSGAGIIANLGCDETPHSLALMGLHSKQIHFHPFIVSGLSDSSEKVGKKIGEKIASIATDEAEKKLLFLFPDGLNINADQLFKGIQQVVSYPIDFVGGTASNDFHLSETYQFCNKEILSDAVSGVLMSGKFDYEIGVSHGCKPIGNYRTITKCQDNIIYEIDHQPALALLKFFIGENRFSDILQVNLLGLGQYYEGRGYSEDIIARAITGFDEEQNSIKLGTQIPVGSVVRFTRKDKNKVKQSTKSTAEQVVNNIQYPDEAAYFYFNCVGRGSYLFGDSDIDVQTILEVLGESKNLIGFFTLGEIAPVAGENYFHNYTGILVGIR
jgi:hypothetical protein